MSSNKDTVTTSASEHLTGRVKWFNNKAGYGFITVTDGPRSGTDVFVHHSAINVENQQYKYLVQGEYVEFNLVKTESEKHEWQASNVDGIRGGKLMCETRHEVKVARSEYRSSKTTTVEQTTSDVAEPKTPRQRTPVDSNDRQRKPRTRGEGPRESSTRGNEDNKEWTLVTGSGPKKARGRPPRKTTNQTTTTN
jgi:cold shock protein